MSRNWIWPGVVAAVLLLGSLPHHGEHPDKAAGRAALEVRQARLDKVWPVPPPADNEADRFWSANNDYLTLWEPDENAPPEVPGRPSFSMHCDASRGLVVQSGIIIGMDLPLARPPYGIMALEAGGLRFRAPLIAVSDGFTTVADADYRLSKSAIRRVLSAPYLVVRPLYLGKPQPYYVMEDVGARHPTPPPALVERFLGACRLPAEV
jgi:hypothetical protein